MATQQIALKEIVVDSTVQIRHGNHEPTIRRYEESFEKLPPVDVFRTPEGNLLADGFHRVAAATRLGHKHIDANVHRGTREDALEFAVIANTKNADPLSPTERDEGIRRLKQLHPGWATRQIAEAMSVSSSTVQQVFRADDVKREVVVPVKHVTSDHYRAVAAAPKEQWEPLVKAADKRGWSKDTTALAVRNLKDTRLPSEHKQKILAGKADPVAFTPDGRLTMAADSIGREIREAESNDAILAVRRALEYLAKLKLFSYKAIVETAGGDELDRLNKDLPGYISFLEQLHEEVKKARRKLEVVR